MDETARFIRFNSIPPRQRRCFDGPARWLRSLLRCQTGLALLMFLGLPVLAAAGGLADLDKDNALTPEALMRRFADFKYELSDSVQDPETFLKRKRGDCDDFANVASKVLASRGYKTKLVAVRMDQQAHVVCYVQEAGGYLDFNQRAKEHPVVKSDGSLEDIARKVSVGFRSNWWAVSEFRFENNDPVFLTTVLH